MKKAIILGILGLFILSFSMGCKSKPKPIRLAQFMTDPVLIEKINLVTAAIEKRHPGLKIQVESIPYNEYQQKITTQMAAGNAPDIIFVEVNNFVDLYLRGAFDDLTPYCQKDNVDLKGYYPDVLGRFSPGGKIYAIPQDTAPTGLMYYNKKLFKEAGLAEPNEKWSWPEPFLTLCKKLTKKDAKGRITCWGYIDAYAVGYDNFMYSNGGNYVDNTDNPTKLTMDDPKVAEAIQFRYDMIHKYRVSPDPSEIQSFNFSAGQVDMFMNGKVAMMSSGLWQTPRFLQDKNLQFDVVEFPRGPRGGKGWGSGGSGYALSSSSKNKEQAWIVLKEMTSEESISLLAQTGMIQPALMKLAQSDVFLKSPGPGHKSILLNMPQYSHYQPFMSNWAEIRDGVIGPPMDLVWMAKKEPKDVLPRINQSVNEKFFSAKK
jgi:multiple sugar transport system substrate-binding protein